MIVYLGFAGIMFFRYDGIKTFQDNLATQYHRHAKNFLLGEVSWQPITAGKPKKFLLVGVLWKPNTAGKPTISCW